MEAKQVIAKMLNSRSRLQSSHAGRVVSVTDDVITIEDLVPERKSFEIPAGRNLKVAK